MKKRLFILLTIVLCAASALYGQDKSIWYYRDHKDEILADAQELYKRGDYDRSLILCDWHLQLLGEEHPEYPKMDKLRSDIQVCKDLVDDINYYLRGKEMEQAKQAGQALSLVNPDDPRLKALGITPPKQKPAILANNTASEDSQKQGGKTVSEIVAERSKQMQKAEEKAEPKPEPKVEPKPEPKKEAPKQEVKPQPQPQPKVEPKSEPKKEAPEQEVKPEPQPKPEPKPEPKSQPAPKKQQLKLDTDPAPAPPVKKDTRPEQARDDFAYSEREGSRVRVPVLVGATFLPFDGKSTTAIGVGVGALNILGTLGLEVMVYPFGVLDMPGSSNSASASVANDFKYFAADVRADLRVFKWLYLFGGPGIYSCTNKYVDSTTRFKNSTSGIYASVGGKLILGGFTINAGVAWFFKDTQVWGYKDVKSTGISYKDFTAVTVIPNGVNFQLGIGYSF